MAAFRDAGDKSTSQADQFIDCPLVFFLSCICLLVQNEIGWISLGKNFLQLEFCKPLKFIYRLFSDVHQLGEKIFQQRSPRAPQQHQWLTDLFKGLCLKPIKYWCKNQVACLRYTERSVARLQGLDLLLCNQYFNYLCVQHLQIIPLFLWMTYNITLVPYCKKWKVIENWPNNQGKRSTFIWIHTLLPW